MSDQTIVRETQDGVSLLRMNRPEKKNAFNGAQYDAFRSALEEAEADDRIGAVVVTGQGNAFSAGQDLSEFDPGQAPDGAAQGFPRFIDALSRFEKPLLAAVNGAGVGIGATLLLHCDVVYLAKSARLRFPFTALGIVPEAASSLLLPLVVGPQRAAELFFTAEWIDAAYALELGIATRVFDDAELLGASLAKAHEIAAQPVGALRATKRLLLATRAPTLQAVLDRELETMAARVGSPENLEAVAAFFEKRPANFRKANRSS